MKNALAIFNFKIRGGVQIVSEPKIAAIFSFIYDNFFIKTLPLDPFAGCFISQKWAGIICGGRGGI
jgi:hypothetical protein